MEKKQSQISDLPQLAPELMENIFHVYKDDKSNFYYYNLLQSVVFPKDLPLSFFTEYTCGYEDTWPVISYKHYKTPNLWWLILLANNIMDATKQPQSGTTLQIPTQKTANLVLAQINQ
jgi:hypothetical protein